MSNIEKFRTGLGLIPVSADPASPVEGQLQFSDGTHRKSGLWQYKDGDWAEIGGGSSGINHIGNKDFEANINDWSTYADAAANKPVDGTGGTANITFTRSTSSPLRGIASGLITKDAVNRQGQGVSVDFTTEEADQYSVQSIEFDYAPSVNYADGDVRVYIYDVTNSQLIEPVPTEILASSVATKAKLYFQTTNSESYRLIFHVASTSALAYTMKIDSVRVGPAIRNFGFAGWKQYDLTVTATNWTTSRAVGIPYQVDDIWRMRFNITGTLSASATALSLTVAGVTFKEITGRAQSISASGSGTARVANRAVANSNASTLSISFSANEDVFYVSGDVELNAKPTFAVREISVQMSDDADTRVVAAKAKFSIDTAVNNAILVFDSEEYDTHGAYDPSTGVFTCPSSGKYRVSSSSLISASAANTIQVRKNSTSVEAFNTGSGDSIALTFSTTIDCSKGDTIDLFTANSVTYDAAGSAGNFCSLSIEKVQGPSSIAANELVALRAKFSGDTAVNNNILVFNSVATGDDTHGAYNASTGIFTLPASGRYRVHVETVITTAVANTIAIRKNSTSVKAGYANTGNGGSLVVADTVRGVKGDTIDIFTPANVTFDAAVTAGDVCVLTIERIGF